MNESPVAGLPAALPPLRSSNGRRRGRVLIVDESRLIRSVFTGALACLHDCTTVASYEDAAVCLKRQDFDVIIADIVTAGASGIRLLEEIAHRYPIQVITLSSAERSSEVDPLPLGVADHLIKPCDIPLLQTAVDNALKRSRERELKRSGEHAGHSDRLVLDTTKASLLAHWDAREMEAAALSHFLSGTAIELQKTIDLIESNLQKLTNELQRQGPDRVSNCHEQSGSTLAEALDDCVIATTQLLDVLQIFARFAAARSATHTVRRCRAQGVPASSQPRMF